MKKLLDVHLALIVGGSSGMGKETARRLIRRNVEPVLLSHNPVRLERARAELEVHGPVQTVDVDLYDESQVDNLIDRIKREERHIKYLVRMAINTVTKINLQPSADFGIVGIQRMPPNAQEIALHDRSLLRRKERFSRKGGQIFVTVFSSPTSQDDPVGV